MTPEQKIKEYILFEHLRFNDEEVVEAEVTADTIDDIYEEVMVDNDYQWDAESDFRCSGQETGLPCDWSRHYESKSVAKQVCGGCWVGWTYWYGGGKHGQPESIDWMSESYFLDCTEQEKVIIARTFTKLDVKPTT